jgi:hypothetical protein
MVLVCKFTNYASICSTSKKSDVPNESGFHPMGFTATEAANISRALSMLHHMQRC